MREYIRSWMPTLLMVATAGVVCIILAMLGTQRAVVVVVRTNPSGATVFDRQIDVGETPWVVALCPDETRHLRLVRRGCQDAQCFLDASHYTPQSLPDHVRSVFSSATKDWGVSLETAAVSNLTVTTEPDGAAVFLDGRRIGMTPLKNTGMLPGSYVLRLEHPECFSDNVELSLAPDQTYTVQRRLRNKWVALYEERISREPASLMHHTDMIHYHILRGDVDEAEKALRRGLDALQKSGATDQNRYIAELWKIHTRYYTYPAETGASRLRPLCREIMTTLLEKKLANEKQLKNYLKRMDAYDKNHPL